MKTYTHPTINLPAGAVVVKFYDPDLTGTETTPAIIKEIGDVEDGFDINLGELYASSCEFKLHNKSNYVISTLLNAARLYVGVIVNNESYFYGEIDLQTIDTDSDRDPSSTFNYSIVSFSAIKIFATLQKTLAYEFENLVYEDLITHAYFSEIGTGDIYLYYRTLFFELAQLCGLKSTAESDIVFDCNREYNDYYYGVPVLFYSLIFNRDNFAAPLPLNKYRDRLDNAFDILGELCREFGLYPDVIYDGTYFKLSIREIDSSRVLTSPAITGRKKIFKYLIKSLFVNLDNIPVALSVTDYRNEQLFTKPFGDHFEMLMHHTNLYSSDGVSWKSDYLFKLKDSTADLSYACEFEKNVGDVTEHTTHQAAMFNHYKGFYYNNPDWYVYGIKGLKATYGGTSKMEYLAPGFYFTDNSVDYLIHTAKKSLMRNRSEVTVIKIS
jgi:hypothetical protein